MAADTTGDVDTSADQTGLSPETQRQSEEAFKSLDPDLRQRLIETTTDPKAKARYEKLAAEIAAAAKPSQPSELSRTGKGESALATSAKPALSPLVATVGQDGGGLFKPPPRFLAAQWATLATKEPPRAAPAEKPPEAPPAPTGQIFGRTTIFHYNHDGSRDKEDPGSRGFFGTNLDDPNLVGAAVPVDILEAQFGKFTQKLPDGTYAALNTPEAQEIIQRIKTSHVLVNAPDGRQVEVPIVDIQGSYKNWHRTLDLTLGAWNALGLKDDSYLGYSIVAGDGTTLSAKAEWSDSSPLARFYQQGGRELAGRPDSEILKAAKARVASDMPDEEYERAMRDPHGEDDLKKYKAQPKQPGEELASVEDSPYFGLDKDTLVKKYYSDMVRAGKIDPAKTDLVDVRQRLFPNAGPVEALSQFFDETSETRAAAGRESSRKIHEESGNIYGWPQALADYAKFLHFGYETPPISKADAWLGKISRVDDLYKQALGWFNGMHEQQKKAAQVDAERAARAERTVAGKIGGVTGGGLTEMLTQVPELGVGGEAKAAALGYGIYQAVSTYGREVAQKGQAQAFTDSIGQLGVGSFWRYGMNSPAGFGTLLGIGWLADTGNDTIQKLVNNEKIDPVDFGIHSVFDLTSAGVFSFLTPKETFKRTGLAEEVTTGPKPKEEAEARAGEARRAIGEATVERAQQVQAERERAEAERVRLRGEVLGPEVSEEMVWHAPGPVVTRMAPREAFTPSELSLAMGELPSGVSTSELSRRAEALRPPPSRAREVHLADPEAGLKEQRNSVIRAETKSMLEAKEAGDIAKAVEHGNRALAHLEPQEQKELAQNITRYTEKFTDNSATPGEEPKEPMSKWEEGMIRFHTGLGSLELHEERLINDAVEIERHLHVDGLEKDAEIKAEPLISEAPAAEAPAEAERVTPAVVGDIGKGLAASMRDMLWEKFQRGETTEAGGPSNILIAAAKEKAAGRINTRADFDALVDRYGEWLKRKQTAPTAKPEETGELYGGLSLKPVVKGIRQLGRAAYESETGRALREKFDPGSFGEVGRTTEAIIRKARTEAEMTIGETNAKLAHDHRMGELLKGGEKVRVRQRFFAKYPRVVQRAMLIAWEKGKHVGDNYAQEIFKFHDAFYKEIERLEKRFGFTYKARDFYIYHLIKGGKAAQDRFKRWFDAKIAADPRWIHKRTYSQLEDLLKAGFELQTYNPEELLQHRFFSSQMAINKVKQLREMERAGDAWNVNRTDLNPAIKALGGSEGELIMRAPNRERYYVKPEALPALTNAWDMGNLFSHRIFGPTFKALAMSKANTIAIKLYGLAHMRHLTFMYISGFNNALTQAGIHGKVTPALFKAEFGRLISNFQGNSAEVKFLRTGKGYDSLSDAQKTNIDYWNRSGGNIRNTDAEQTRFASWAHQTFSDLMEKMGVPRGTRPTVHGSATILEAGYNASMAVNDWQFHSFIPQLKWNHFLTLKDDLLRKHPELTDTKNEWKLNRELTKIGKEVDSRFGEKFYDNLLWPKTWKQVGTNLLLSLGWNLGGGRMYAGAFHDTSVLIGKVLEDPQRLLHPIRLAREDLTERMTFMLNYHVMNTITCALVNYAAVSAWNYMHPDKKQDPIPKGSLWPSPDSDFTFPRTGALDEAGRPKRLAPVEYPREIAIWWQHVREKGLAGGSLTMAQHKLNPILSTLTEDMQNRNFYGQEIYDPNDVVMVGGVPWPNFKQIQDRVGHLLGGWFTPISVASAPPTTVGPIKFGKVGGSWFDTAWSFFGLPPASRAVNRTDTENLIYDIKHRLTGTIRTDIDNQKYDQYNALRQAIKAKDLHAQRQAEDALWKLGTGDKAIKGFETHLRKHPDEKADEHMWKAFPAEEHKQALLRMGTSDRHKYYKMLTPEGQLAVLKVMAIESPNELKFFWSITDKKLLDKYEREARAHHAVLAP